MLVIDQELFERVIEAINAKAKEKRLDENEDGSWNEDYNPSDGGNYDDTKTDGEHDGEIDFARYLKSILKGKE